MYVCTCIHTCIHTYIHTYMHTQADLVRVASVAKTALEQTHVWVLAHVLRRPIIVYAILNIRNFRDEVVDLARHQVLHRTCFTSTTKVQILMQSNIRNLRVVDLAPRQVLHFTCITSTNGVKNTATN